MILINLFCLKCVAFDLLIWWCSPDLCVVECVFAVFLSLDVYFFYSNCTMYIFWTLNNITTISTEISNVLHDTFAISYVFSSAATNLLDFVCVRVVTCCIPVRNNLHLKWCTTKLPCCSFNKNYCNFTKMPHSSVPLIDVRRLLWCYVYLGIFTENVWE